MYLQVAKNILIFKVFVCVVIYVDRCSISNCLVRNSYQNMVSNLYEDSNKQDNVQINSESVQCHVFETCKVFDYQYRYCWLIIQVTFSDGVFCKLIFFKFQPKIEGVPVLKVVNVIGHSPFELILYFCLKLHVSQLDTRFEVCSFSLSRDRERVGTSPFT